MRNLNYRFEVERIRTCIDREWISNTAQELVNIPSVTMDENAVCSCFKDKLRELGLGVDVREITSGRYNLYAKLPKNKLKFQHEILNTHIKHSDLKKFVLLF